MTAALHTVNGFGTDTGAVLPAVVRIGTGEQSDDELLSVLDGQVQRTGKRPTRQEVMEATGTGTTRATRLLDALDQLHDWPRPGTKRGTRKTTGGRTRAGTKMTPRPRRVPVQQSGATALSTAPTPGTETDTDAADLATVATVSPTGTGTAPERPTGTSTQTAQDATAANVGTGTETGTAKSSGTGLRGGRFVSWLGFGFGSVVSIAGNVLHAWLPPAHAPADWHPGLIPQLGAAVWPVMLLLAVEVLSRVRWRDGFLWRVARYGGTGTVAIGAAVISYGHVTAVLAAWGYGPVAAGVGPLVIDGLMVISGFALLSNEQENA